MVCQIDRNVWELFGSAKRIGSLSTLRFYVKCTCTSVCSLPRSECACGSEHVLLLHFLKVSWSPVHFTTSRQYSAALNNNTRQYFPIVLRKKQSNIITAIVSAVQYNYRTHSANHWTTRAMNQTQLNQWHLGWDSSWSFLDCRVKRWVLHQSNQDDKPVNRRFSKTLTKNIKVSTHFIDAPICTAASMYPLYCKRRNVTKRREGEI